MCIKCQVAKKGATSATLNSTKDNKRARIIVAKFEKLLKAPQTVSNWVTLDFTNEGINRRRTPRVTSIGGYPRLLNGACVGSCVTSGELFSSTLRATCVKPLLVPVAPSIPALPVAPRLSLIKATDVQPCGNCGATDEEPEGDGYCEGCFDDAHGMCEGCEESVLNEDLQEFSGGYCTRFYCEKCFDERFFSCESCGDVHRIEDGHEANGDIYCSHCFYEEFNICTSCGDVIPNDDSYSSEYGTYCESCYEPESEGSNCPSPGNKNFSISGYNSETFHVAPKVDTRQISTCAYYKIASVFQKISDQTGKRVYNPFGYHECLWVTDKGAYSTRLNKEVKTRLGIDLKKTTVKVMRKKARKDGETVVRDEFNQIIYDDVEIEVNALSEIGQIAKEGLPVEKENSFFLTRELGVEGDGYYFGHEGSCWYEDGEHSKSLCALKHVHGIAYLLSETADRDEINARCWVIPVKSNDGTLNACETDEARGYVLFNAYLSGRDTGLGVMAESFAQVCGMKVNGEFGFRDDDVYINGNRCILVGLPEFEGEILRVNGFGERRCDC